MAVFDKKAKYYDAWYESKIGSFADKVETELAFRLFEPKNGMKVLDVGCGTGLFSIKLAGLGCKVTGIDISKQMIDIAKRKAVERNLSIDFYQMDVNELNFEEESFDAVFSMATLEFIENTQKAYNQMYKVLKKDGPLLIGSINKDSKWAKMYMSKTINQNSIFKHANFRSIKDIEDLDRKNVVTSRECLFIPPDTTLDNINMEMEKKMAITESGGFFCVLFRKPE